MLSVLALAFALSQDLQAVVDQACDLDPAIRAGAPAAAARFDPNLLDARQIPARIVLALAGKHDPGALLRLTDRSARIVGCDLLTPSKAQLPDVLALLESKDRGVRIAAGRALGRVEDPDLRRAISSALGHGMRRAGADDVLFAFVVSAWQGNASSHLFQVGDSDPDRAGLAVAAFCNVPSLVVTEGFAPTLLRALENEKIERPLRSLLVRVVGRGSPGVLCPALGVRDKELRSRIVEVLDRSLVDPLAAPALYAAGRDPRLQGGPLVPWIEERLKKLCGDGVTLETYPQWAQAKYGPLVEKQADAAVAKGAAGLLKQVERSATWKSSPGGLVGLSAFAAYALLKSDVAPGDPGIARCLDAVLDRDPQGIYATSLSALALSAAVEKGCPRRERLERRLQTIADILVASQLKSGGWSYVAVTGLETTAGWTYDLSNTQFAILGLRAAANGGAKIPRATWERALVLLEKAQLDDGGWTYQGKDAPSYPRMTAAGAYSWMICRITLDEKLAPATAADSFRIRNATQWLARATDASQMPTLPDFYLLYSVERLCMIAGIPALGGRDWYTEGAAILLRSQGPDGLWRGSHGTVPDTCMALLFLRKAFVARPDIPTETARKRATPEQALEVLERRRDSLLADGVKEVRADSDGRTSFLLLLVESDADAKRLSEKLGREIDGVPLRFKVRE
jgi:hypothetical protein